jgi:hypothetical protein
MNLMHNETFAAVLAGIAGMGLWAALIATVATQHMMPIV